MFKIESPRQVKLLNVNPRAEKHGPDLQSAADLKMQFEASNDFLAVFDAGLKASFYCAAREGNQAPLEGVEPVSDMPDLRYPQIHTVAWDREQTGMTFTIDYGTGGKSNLVLKDAKVNQFVFDLREGGTVTVTFRMQASGLHEKELGRLCILIGSNILVTLEGPTVVQDDLVAAGLATPKPSELAADATTAFLAHVATKSKAGATKAKAPRVSPPPKSKAPLAKKIARAGKKATAKPARRTSGRKR